MIDTGSVVHAQKAATLFVDDTNTTISITSAGADDDVVVYLSSPDWYQYTAVGFGSAMAGSLMLVAYAAADNAGMSSLPSVRSLGTCSRAG